MTNCYREASPKDTNVPICIVGTSPLNDILVAYIESP